MGFVRIFLEVLVHMRKHCREEVCTSGRRQLDFKYIKVFIRVALLWGIYIYIHIWVPCTLAKKNLRLARFFSQTCGDDRSLLLESMGKLTSLPLVAGRP